MDKLIKVCRKCANSALWLVLFIVGISIVGGCMDSDSRNRTIVNPGDTVEVIIDHYWESERILLANASVEDTLAKSEATFKQTSTMRFDNGGEELLYNFYPDAYVKILLEKARIEVESENDLPATLTRARIVSRTPYHSGTTLGEDVVKVCEYSDGQKATISYGYRYMAYVSGEDTLAVPHVEVEPVEYLGYELENFGEVTETEDPYKQTLEFAATYFAEGVSTGGEHYDVVKLKPWYRKVITDEATQVEDVTYSGKYIGCPFTAYELTEKVKTNKGEETHTYRVDLALELTPPAEREQPSRDSVFNDVSTGKLSEKMLTEIKTEDGFTVQTMSGTYTSANTGKEAGTTVESTVSFTYQKPVRFESEYGSYDIPDIGLKFGELNFAVDKVAEDESEKTFRSVNTIYGEIADCTLEPVDEVVLLKISTDKPGDVAKVDSTYTLTGEDDDYIVDKEIIWSDGSKTHEKYSYQGRHSATAVAFGEVITTSLDWSESELAAAATSKETEEKKFSATTKFTATYTTTSWQSNASNRVERGVFTFRETSPAVVFTDGKTVKEFPVRKYTMTGLGADVAANFVTMVHNGVTYKAYSYDYTAKAAWNGGNPATLVSEGYLLIAADETGEPVYTTEQTWNGKTTTVTVIKTTPHSYGEDEKETFTKSFTVEIGELSDGKVYAENTNFSTRETHSFSTGSQKDGNWLVKTYTETYRYVTSNGAVNREQEVKVKDAEITFDDGAFSHTFNVRLTPQMSEALLTQNVRTEGNYTVTPHRLAVRFTTPDGQRFDTEGITDIYVENQEATVERSSKKTIVYNDGTVDFVLEKEMSDGTTQTVRAADTYGARFAFDFANTDAQTRVVANVDYAATGAAGQPQTSNRNRGNWSVTEYRYPYIHTMTNGVAADKIDSPYAYSTFSATLADEDLGTVTFDMPTVTMTPVALQISPRGTANGYDEYGAAVTVAGSARGTEGSYSRNLSVTHILRMTADDDDEPDDPHFGKPKGFFVTATFDPSAKVTRRAFVFQWERGVTYAVCDYETDLPASNEFMYKADSYQGYNSVGYDAKSGEWLPARAIDTDNTLEWYFSNGQLMAAVSDFECMTYGWKNIVNGEYALVIDGYDSTVNGYKITVVSPGGNTVTFDSHYER